MSMCVRSYLTLWKSLKLISSPETVVISATWFQPCFLHKLPSQRQTAWLAVPISSSSIPHLSRLYSQLAFLWKHYNLKHISRLYFWLQVFTGLPTLKESLVFTMLIYTNAVPTKSGLLAFLLLSFWTVDRSCIILLL